MVQAWISIYMDNGEVIKYVNSSVFNGKNKEYYRYETGAYDTQLGIGRIKGDYEFLLSSIETPDTLLSFPEYGDADFEETELTFSDDTAGSNSSYDGSYFDIYDITNQYRVWYNLTDGDSTAPAAESSTLVKVDITTTSTNAEIATLTATALENLDVFSCSTLTNVITVSHLIAGVTTDANAASISTVAASTTNTGSTDTGTSRLVRTNKDQPTSSTNNLVTAVHVPVINTIKVVENELDSEWYF